MQSLFITFEGNEGSGKTTIISEMNKLLLKMGYTVTQTREPGGSNISEQIRNIILNKKNIDMDYRTEALLLAASRRQHLIDVILPALKAGHFVLCDRYVDSSLAYQGYARGIGIDEVYDVNAFAINHLLPDLTIYIKIDPKVGLERISSNNRNVNRLDLETLDFHNRVSKGYDILCQKFPNRIVVIDGDQPLAGVISDAKKVLLTKIQRK